MKLVMSFLTIAIIVLLVVRCAKPNSGIEVTNGICIGTIYDKDLSVAAGALVQIIPSGFDPTDSLLSSIQPESTFTDQNGKYSFLISETDFYNVIAEKNNASCMLDSVSLFSEAINTIENDTLEQAGWLVGTIEVKREDDATLSVLLLPGTSIYTSPVDSIGTILPLALPAGNYPVTIFTSEIGYEVMDTSIVITSGDTTNLIVRIPSSYAPQINSFILEYDSSLQSALLKWSPSAPIVKGSYALRRIVNGTTDSVIMLSNTVSEYNDDCMEFIEDTIVYELSVLNVNFKQGYPITAPVLIPGMKQSAVKKLLLVNSKYNHKTWKQFFVDQKKNIYGIYGTYGSLNSDHDVLIKQSPDGTQHLEKNANEICRTGACDSSSRVTFANAFIDTMDNIYVTTDPQGSRQLTMYKLDTEFNTINSFDIPRSLLNHHDYSTPESRNPITVGQDGSIFFHNYDVYTTITVYDSDFNHICAHTIYDMLTVKDISGDTIITLRNDYPYTVQLFDRSFNLISSYETTVQSDRIAGFVFVLSPDLYISKVFQEKNVNPIQGRYIYTLVDKSGKQFVKLGIPDITSFSFKSIDRIYGLHIESKPILYEFNLMPYLTKQ